jgi:restriction endonuclease Mrr
MLIRWSRARRDYSCHRCHTTIAKGTEYGRDEPFPAARYAGETVKHLCKRCLIPYLKERRTTRFLLNLRGTNYVVESPDHLSADLFSFLRGDAAAMQWPVIPDAQLQLALREMSEAPDQAVISESRIEVLDFAEVLLQELRRNPQELHRLDAEQFELFICNRLAAMGMGTTRVGTTHQKDGGIDIVAWPEQDPVFPFLLAVQAKHHSSTRIKTGPKEVREFRDVIEHLPFQAGLLVTNTTFTPDARWAASNRAHLVRLRDFDDLKRWIMDEFLDEAEWREIPDYIEYAPGKKLWIPRKNMGQEK